MEDSLVCPYSIVGEARPFYYSHLPTGLVRSSNLVPISASCTLMAVSSLLIRSNWLVCTAFMTATSARTLAYWEFPTKVEIPPPSANEAISPATHFHNPFPLATPIPLLPPPVYTSPHKNAT